MICKYLKSGVCEYLSKVTKSTFNTTDMFCRNVCQVKGLDYLVGRLKGVIEISEPKPAISVELAAMRIQYCGQVCGGLHDETCDMTTCAIKKGRKCPQDKWKE